MKHHILLLSGILLLCISCSYTNSQQGRDNVGEDSLGIEANDIDTTCFSYDRGYKIATAVYLNGKKHGAIFDTGGDGAVLSIETFPELRDSTCEKSQQVENGWSGDAVNGYTVEKGLDIILPTGDTLHYNEYTLCSMPHRFSPEHVMILSIPENYDRVINIDYEKRHLRSCDKVPQEVIEKSSLKSPINRYRHKISITLPLSFVFDNDTVGINVSGEVDTGCDIELAILGNVKPMLDERADNQIIKHLIAQDDNNAYYLCKEANVINGNFVFKKSKYTGHEINNIFGNNLLCHYNFYFDFKEGIAYGIAVKDAQKPIDIIEGKMAGEFAEGRCIVTSIVKDSYFEKAGIEIGDCILTCDDKSMLEISKDYFKGRVAKLVLIRNGELLTLEVTEKTEDEL